MSNFTDYSATETERLCGECLTWHDIKDYRIVDYETLRRHTICRECFNDRERRRRAAKRRGETLADLHRLRQCQTIEQVYKIITGVASKLGGIRALVLEWIRLANDADASDQQRLSVTRSLIHLHILADYERLQSYSESTSEPADAESIAETVERWHRSGKLAPALRELYVNGQLSLDDIDPPPSEYLAE